ncbi:MAG TPA: carboxypeptidase-like regulatory domain-containing protein [Acidobacteriaceae bacterium]
MTNNISVTNNWMKLTLLLCLIALPAFAMAQLGGEGSINGTVTDPSGAIVPDASVTATNVATGTRTIRTATSSGYYVLSPLDPGTYSVSVVAKGFKTLTQENIVVNALQVVGLNIGLKVGSVDENVEVTAAPPALDTVSATIGGTIENETYKALPLQMNGNPRDPTAFVYLMPGVSQGNSGSSGVYNGTGSIGRIDEVFLDGVPTTRIAQQGDARTVSASISVEAVDQFQVLTGGSPIEYQGIGVQNYVSKSGTNQLHGSLFEFFRNTALDTWSWGSASIIDPKTGKPTKPVEHQNEFGLAAGGPAIKNRVFLYGVYDGYRYVNVGNPQLGTLPTLRQRAGDFADLPASQSIYDPATTSCTSGKCTRQQFSYLGANNVINPSRVSSISKALISGLPAPTNATAVANNWISAPVFSTFTWKASGKLDAVLNQKQRISALFASNKSYPYGYTPFSGFGVPLPVPWVSAQVGLTYARDLILEHNYTITSHLVNQLKYGFFRNSTLQDAPTHNKLYGAFTAYGITGLPSGQAQESYPNVNFAGPNAGSSFAIAKNDNEITNTFALLDNAQYVKGKHSITVGLVHQWLEDNYTMYVTGTSPVLLGYSNAQTAGFSTITGSSGGTLVNTQGDAYASFLLGQVNSASLTHSAVVTSYGRMYPWSIYSEDDIAVTPKLTLNIGLRWDYFPPFYEAKDRLSWLNPNLTNPAVNYPGALQFGGNGTNACNCRSPLMTWHKNIGPRLGVAYALGSKTVIRGAYTLNFTHATGAMNIGRSGPGNIGYTANVAPVSPSSGVAAFILDNGFPSYQLPPFLVPSFGTGFSTTITTTALSPTYDDPVVGARGPYAANWNVGIERQLMRNVTLEVNYVGTQGHFLPPAGNGARGYWANELDPMYYSLGTLLNATPTPSNLAAAQAIIPSVKLPYATFGGSGGTIAQMLRPFPQYSGVSDTYGNIANSNYNAVQVVVKKRMSNGLDAMVNYTFSHEIDNQGTYRNGYLSPRVERARGAGDTPQILNLTFVYNLPLGRGHSFGANNLIVRSVVSDWQLSGIYTFNAGQPLQIAGTCTTPNGGTCMPNYSTSFSGPIRINGSWGTGALGGIASPSYINKAAFVDPPAYSIGNLARTFPLGLRGPWSDTLSMSVKRSFPLFENVKLLLDVSAYNVTNNVRFGISSLSIDSGTFGQVSGQTNTSRDIQLAARINF